MFTKDPKKLNKDGYNEPVLNADENARKDISVNKRLALFLVCLVGSILFSLIALLLTKPLPLEKRECAAGLISYAFLFISLLFLLGKDVKPSLRIFKKWKPYVYGLIGGAILMCLTNGFSRIINLLHPIEDSQNQALLETTINYYPVISFIIFGFIGPFCEELGYRTGLFGGLKKINKVAAYFIASIVFGLIHMSISGNIANELLNLPIYILSGFILAYIYDKCGFVASFTAHALNNCLAMIFIITGVQ